MIEKGYSGKAADIWSLGVTFYAFHFLQLPFFHETMEQTQAAIKNKRCFQKFNINQWQICSKQNFIKFLVFFRFLLKIFICRLIWPESREISKEWKDLLNRMMEKNPEKRIKIRQIKVKHFPNKFEIKVK